MWISQFFPIRLLLTFREIEKLISIKWYFQMAEKENEKKIIDLILRQISTITFSREFVKTFSITFYIDLIYFGIWFLRPLKISEKCSQYRSIQLLIECSSYRLTTLLPSLYFYSIYIFLFFFFHRIIYFPILYLMYTSELYENIAHGYRNGKFTSKKNT